MYTQIIDQFYSQMGSQMALVGSTLATYQDQISRNIQNMTLSASMIFPTIESSLDKDFPPGSEHDKEDDDENDDK